MNLASGHTARAVNEWIGSSPDAAVPEHVRIRIFERYKGKCQLSNKKLRGSEWDLDHIKPLKDGGEHREGNLWPVLRLAHRAKTAKENSERAKENRVKRKHLLPRKTKHKWPSRKFNAGWADNTKYINCEADPDT